MLLNRRRRRDQEERPDRRRRKLRDIEEDDWRGSQPDPDTDFEDDLLVDDLSDVNFENESVN